MGVGGAICGSFVVLGALSVVLYGPWRRWVERGRKRRGDDGGEGGGDEIASVEDKRKEDREGGAEKYVSARATEVEDGMQGIDAIESVASVGLVEFAK